MRPTIPVVLDLHCPRRIEAALFDQSDRLELGSIHHPPAVPHIDSPGRVTFRDRLVPSPARWVTLIVVSTFTASTALPYEHLERATAGLRAELRQKLLHAGVHEMPIWETFDVTGPYEFTDLRGRTCFEYRAALNSRGPFDRA